MTTPYEDGREHLRDELQLLDLRLIEYLSAWRAERGGAGDQFRGMYVSDDEVDRLLGIGPHGQPRPNRESAAGGGPRAGGSGTSPGDEGGQPASGHSGTDDRSLAGRSRSLREQIRARERHSLEAGVELRLPLLARRFGLERREVDALLAVLAPEIDTKYEKIYAYLQDDLTRKRPTVGLIGGILGHANEQLLAVQTLFSGTSPLVRNRMVRVGEEGLVPSSVVRAEPRIVAFLAGDDAMAPALSDLTTVTEPTRDLVDLDIEGRRRERLEALAERKHRALADGTSSDPAHGAPLLAGFHGPHGAGKADAVAALSAAWDRPMLGVDAGELAGDARETVRLLLREARLRDAAVHVRNVGALVATDARPIGNGDGAATPDARPRRPDLDDVLEWLDGYDGPVFLTGTDRLPAGRYAAVENHQVTTLSFPRSGYERRRTRWEAVEDLPADVDPAELAGTFRLTGGQLADAVATARALADGDGLTREALYEGCRAQTRERLGSLARRIDPGYTWDDIVLPDDVMAHLREVTAHVRQRDRVFDEWGFAEKYSLGNGYNVLFTGPPGTGKTMAAEIVAGDAGLDLYRVDLSNVVSKYIGETESNLGQLFDEAARSNAVLFFDEADALFGERTEVQDSHDRYANVEVNYLLQRMEAHDGTTILASNLEENIDDAFRRRINSTVEFPFPNRELRAEIWRTVFPVDVPMEEVDIEFLSSFEMAGGNIKNAALTAALMAADDESAVEMEHAVKATQRELQKLGQLITPDDFEEYHKYL